MTLATAITIVGDVELPAMQAPGSGSSFHRQTRNEPPKLEENASEPRRKSPHHSTHEQDREEEFCVKFRKKNSPHEIRFSNRPNYPISKSPLAAVKERGLRVPEDVSVVGFDDQELIAPRLRPRLTTIRVPYFEMGSWAVEHLLKNRQEPTNSKKQIVTLECPLVLRSSVSEPSRRSRSPSAGEQASPAGMSALSGVK
jgi:hypothetical protein